MKRLHGLLERGVVVEAMDLEDIDVVGVEALERGVDLVEDGRAREVVLVDVVLGLLERLAVQEVAHVGLLAHAPEALGHDDDLLARDTVLLDGLADNDLAHALRVHVGCVPCVDAAVVRSLEQRQRLPLMLAMCHRVYKDRK